MKLSTQLLIDGQFVTGEGQAEPILNPANGEQIAAVPEASFEQVNRAVNGAQRAFAQWSRTTRQAAATCCCVWQISSSATPRSSRRLNPSTAANPIWQCSTTSCPRWWTASASLPGRPVVCKGRWRGASRGAHQHDPPRPHRCCGQYRPLELPADDGGLEDGAGAGGGQYGGAQTLRTDPAHRAAFGGAGQRIFPAALSTSSAGGARV